MASATAADAGAKAQIILSVASATAAGTGCAESSPAATKQRQQAVQTLPRLVEASEIPAGGLAPMCISLLGLTVGAALSILLKALGAQGAEVVAWDKNSITVQVHKQELADDAKIRISFFRGVADLESEPKLILEFMRQAGSALVNANVFSHTQCYFRDMQDKESFAMSGAGDVPVQPATFAPLPLLPKNLQDVSTSTQDARGWHRQLHKDLFGQP